MGWLGAASARLRSYAAHPDPLVATANTVALLVASNQPFYPLYLRALVGEGATLSLFTFLSTPFFLAVPAVSRINSVLGRALLPVAGIGNTVLCAKLFGVESAVEAFLIPCALLALLLFRPRERLYGFVIAGFCFALYLLMHDAYGQTSLPAGFAGYTALARLNVMSAAALTCVVGLMFSNVLAAAERSGEAARRDISR